MKLTIDRSRWYRGRLGSALVVANSRVPEDNGKMCCLGFLGVACGADNTVYPSDDTPTGILMKEMPTSNQDLWPKWLFEGMLVFGDIGAVVADTLADVNDDKSISDEMREKQIIQIMGQHGVEVEFV